MKNSKKLSELSDGIHTVDWNIVTVIKDKEFLQSYWINQENLILV